MEIIVGILGGITTGLGMGGGTILIAFLTLFLSIEQHISQAINIMFFIPVAIVSILINLKNKLIRWKKVSFIIIFGIIGVVIGAKLALILDTNTLKKYFGYFLILVMFYEIYDLLKNLKIKNK